MSDTNDDSTELSPKHRYDEQVLEEEERWSWGEGQRREMLEE